MRMGAKQEEELLLLLRQGCGGGSDHVKPNISAKFNQILNKYSHPKAQHELEPPTDHSRCPGNSAKLSLEDCQSCGDDNSSMLVGARDLPLALASTS